MKQLKKVLLIMMCAGMMASVTACADNADDNGAGQNDVVNDNGTNDTGNGDSAMDEIGDSLEDGADDVGRGVNDVVDDLDGDGQNNDRANTNNNTVNDATTGNDNVNDRQKIRKMAGIFFWQYNSSLYLRKMCRCF